MSNSKTLKIIVDYDLCEANALCVEAAPEVFKLDENDDLQLLMENPPESLREKVDAAIRVCPKAALKLG